MEQRALRTPSPLLLRRESAVVGHGHGQRTREALEERVPSFLHGDELLKAVLPSYILLHPEATLRLAPMPMLKVKVSVKV